MQIPVARLFSLATLLLLSAALSGCGQSGSASRPSAAPASTQAAAPAAAPPAASPAPAAAIPPPSAPASSTPALATTDGESPGVQLAVTELKRTSGSLTLRFTIFNNRDQEFPPVFDGDQWNRFRHLGAVHLIDGVSKKKYFVVTDSDGNFLCSNAIPNIAPKSQLSLWAKFPLPPDDVQKITVEIPHFPPMEDVPISR